MGLLLDKSRYTPRAWADPRQIFHLHGSRDIRSNGRQARGTSELLSGSGTCPSADPSQFPLLCGLRNRFPRDIGWEGGTPGSAARHWNSGVRLWVEIAAHALGMPLATHFRDVEVMVPPS